MVVIRLVGGNRTDMWVPKDKKVAAIKSPSDPIHTYLGKIADKLKLKTLEGYKLFTVCDKADATKWKGAQSTLSVREEMNIDLPLTSYGVESAGDFVVVVGPGGTPSWLSIEGETGTEPEPEPAKDASEPLPPPVPVVVAPPVPLSDVALKAAQHEVLQMRGLLQDMSTKLECAKIQTQLFEESKKDNQKLREELLKQREECMVLKEAHKAELLRAVEEREMLKEEGAKLRLVSAAKTREISALSRELEEAKEKLMATPLQVEPKEPQFTTYQYIKAYELTTPDETQARHSIKREEAEQWQSVLAFATPLRWAVETTSLSSGWNPRSLLG